MFAFRTVLVTTGGALTVLAIGMVLAAGVDFAHACPDWKVFLASAAVCLFVGGLLVTGHRTRRFEFGVRQSFLLVPLAAVALTAAASLPFAFSSLHLSTTDALFESVAGLTATGATVLRGLDSTSGGILLWRAILQWLGGMGFLIMAIIVLPSLGVGGMSMFRLELVGLDSRINPRAARTALLLIGIYTALTVLIALLLWAAGMSRFPALVHAMSTISCGGFSTADGSIGSWHSPPIDWVVLLGMLLGGAPFIIFVQLFQQRWRSALRNTQVWWYLGIFLSTTLVFAVWLLFVKDVKPLPALRHGAFTAASVMTGTGYATLDWGSWAQLPAAILLFVAFIGGCTGSTAGGLKIFRFQVLFAAARGEFLSLLRPHAVHLPTYECRPIPSGVVESVLGFLFIYLIAIVVVALGLGFLGLDFLSALSTAASAMANLGPGLTPIVGPMAGMVALPDAAKWLLMGAMLFGRLEMFILLVLFVPGFWKP